MIEITPPPLSPQSMADLLCTIMVLCRGVDDEGQDFWAYMCIKPSMAKPFREAMDGGDVHLEEYGTIIETGPGRDVPVEVMQRMERDYGMNHHCEDDILAATQKRESESA